MAEPGKIGVVAATLMVAGNIMGSGVFMLRANLAATGGIAMKGMLNVVAIAMTVIMLLTLSPSTSQQFDVISSISVIFALVAYLPGFGRQGGGVGLHPDLADHASECAQPGATCRAGQQVRGDERRRSCHRAGGSAMNIPCREFDAARQYVAA